MPKEKDDGKWEPHFEIEAGIPGFLKVKAGVTKRHGNSTSSNATQSKPATSSPSAASTSDQSTPQTQAQPNINIPAQSEPTRKSQTKDDEQKRKNAVNRFNGDLSPYENYRGPTPPAIEQEKYRRSVEIERLIAVGEYLKAADAKEGLAAICRSQGNERDAYLLENSAYELRQHANKS